MKSKVVFLLIPVLIIMGLFLACSDEGTKIVVATSCTITFDPVGGLFDDDAEELSISVGRNQPMDTQYPTPTRDGYEFCGWFDGFTRYTANDPIDTSLTLTAKWAPEGTVSNMVTVTFVMETGVTGAVPVNSIQVVQGEPMGHKYPISWRTGFNFAGWFDGVEGAGSEYERTTPITGAITLTAKWAAKIQWDVKFDSGPGNYFPGTITGGTLGDVGGDINRTFTIQVYDGDGIWDKLPAKPTNGLTDAFEEEDQYFLVYWRNEENLPYVENTFIPITDDITLKPKWGAPDYIVPLVDGLENSPELVSINLGTAGDPNQSNPVFRATEGEDEDGNPITIYTIWNSNENNSTGRWQMMYWIKLNLPPSFNVRLFNKYSVNANFYGNIKATAAYRTVNFPQDTLMPSQYYIENAGDQMIPNRHGYGQVSFCVSNEGTGEAANSYTIFQQYNLGMGQDGDGGSVNSTWKPSNPSPDEEEETARDPFRPAYLLIQTSDDWIGHIEITEIRFHNDPDAVVELE